MRDANGRIFLAVLLSVALAAPVAAADDAWQGQGQGQGRGNDERGNARGQGRDDDRAQGNQQRGNAERRNQGTRPTAEQARGQSNQGRGNADVARGRSDDARGAASVRRRDRPDRAQLRAQVDRMPANLRSMANSSRRGDRIVAGALARASLRGASADRFRVESDGGRWAVRNSRNEVLIDMDEDDARRMGHWEMRRLGDRRPNDNAPAFCRSGAGHPVWGREWCLDKGFGLGSDERSIWSRSTSIGDIIFRKDPDKDLTLDRGGLIDVLGDVIFGRLAVQSLVMGNDDPLVGRWVVSDDEPDAPAVLLVSSGDVHVAEFVDDDRDDDIDVLFVAQPRW